jgi:hypothetical protein
VQRVAINTPTIPMIGNLSEDSPVVRGIPKLTMPFVSSIGISETPHLDRDFVVLARSSEESGRSQSIRRIDPYSLRERSLGEAVGSFPVLVSARGVFDSAFVNREAPDPGEGQPEELLVRESAATRLVLAGTSHFMANNVSAMLNLVDWLVADESMVDIRSKLVQLPALDPLEAAHVRNLKLINLLLPSLLLLAMGALLRLQKRRAS